MTGSSDTFASCPRGRLSEEVVEEITTSGLRSDEAVAAARQLETWAETPVDGDEANASTLFVKPARSGRASTVMTMP